MVYSFNTNELNSFRATNALLKNPSQPRATESFEEVFENTANEITTKAKEETNEIIEKATDTKKKKEKKETKDLPNISQIMQTNDRRHSEEVRSTYLLLDKFKENSKSQDNELSKGLRQQVLENSHNLAGQPMFERVYDRGQRKMTKAHVLEHWEKLAPSVTEDITKKSVRIDIPMLNDVQALVLRLHPDKSITASLLGSQAMGELIKQNKDKLDRNLKHHHLSLREFNTYQSELTFNGESGTRKKKHKAKSGKKKLEPVLI